MVLYDFARAFDFELIGTHLGQGLLLWLDNCVLYSGSRGPSDWLPDPWLGAADEDSPPGALAGLRGGGEPGPGEQGQDDARQGHQGGRKYYYFSIYSNYIEKLTTVDIKFGIY